MFKGSLSTTIVCRALYGSMGLWVYGSVGLWVCGSVGLWVEVEPAAVEKDGGYENSFGYSGREPYLDFCSMPAQIRRGRNGAQSLFINPLRFSASSAPLR